jgi:hypothetical protein
VQPYAHRGDAARRLDPSCTRGGWRKAGIGRKPICLHEKIVSCDTKSPAAVEGLVRIIEVLAGYLSLGLAMSGASLLLRVKRRQRESMRHQLPFDARSLVAFRPGDDRPDMHV